MPESRKKYARQFHEDVIQIVEEIGKAIAQIARDLDVNEGTLDNWVARAKKGRWELSKDDVEELERLRAETAELQMERDVLERSGPCGSRWRRNERGTLHR